MFGEVRVENSNTLITNHRTRERQLQPIIYLKVYLIVKINRLNQETKSNSDKTELFTTFTPAYSLPSIHF